MSVRKIVSLNNRLIKIFPTRSVSISLNAGKQRWNKYPYINVEIWVADLFNQTVNSIIEAEKFIEYIESRFTLVYGEMSMIEDVKNMFENWKEQSSDEE